MTGYILGLLLLMFATINAIAPIPIDQDTATRAAIYLTGTALCWTLADTRRTTK